MSHKDSKARVPIRRGHHHESRMPATVTKSDLELVLQSRCGETGALAELFERYYMSSVCVARGILRSDEDAQDAVQVAFFSAFRHLSAFRGDSSFKTWITRIVVNCCLMQLRASRRRALWVRLDYLEAGQGQKFLASRSPSPEDFASRGEIASACSGAVSKLPPHLREAFTLYADLGLSVKEVAAALGVTLPAAKTRIFRARTRLQGDLQAMRA